MIDISKLYCQKNFTADSIRYGETAEGKKIKRSGPLEQRPVVVWNITNRCNLFCKHCYSVLIYLQA